MTEEQIKHMVTRFLGWKLPKEFRPDAGIKYVPPSYVSINPDAHWPSGTNLFDAAQAEAMVRYLVDGVPDSPMPVVIWQDGVGMLWDVHSHGKFSKKVVSPIGWDAWSVYRYMVDVGKFASHIDVRLADTRAAPQPTRQVMMDDASIDSAVPDSAVPVEDIHRIVCAANRKAFTGEIVLGLRHWDAFMREMYSYVDPVDQGFLDNHGKFLSRTEAWPIAKAAGQIIRRVGGDGYNGGTLYSENLY